MKRRSFLLGGAAMAGAVLGLRGVGATTSNDGYEVNRTTAEWREILAPDQFAVMREEATERPYTSPLLEEDRAGVYHCAACDQALYDASTKFDSGTGWPSFWQAIDGSVGTSVDRKFFLKRTEVHCARCGGHLGHVFNDGPQPTGKRHCVNGVALSFAAA